MKLTRLSLVSVMSLVLPIVGRTMAQDLSGSSRAASASGAAAVGAQVGEQVQAFAEGVPELQQTDRAGLRDTGNRGGFVGADTGDTGFFGEASGTGTRRTTGRSTGRRTTGRSQMQPRSQQAGGPTIRPTLTLGFRYAPRPAPNLAQNVVASLNRIPQLEGSSSIRVSINGSTVTLEGTVPTPHDRALTEQLVALSPGVMKIQNRLAVAEVSGDLPAGQNE